MEDFDSELKIIEYADTLLPNRDNAKMLLDLTESYDIFYLYDLIFNGFIKYLTNDEKENLIKKCKNTFDPELLKISSFFDKL